MRRVDAPVHNIGWAGNGDIQFVCDKTWGEPKWGPDSASRTADPEVFVADDDRLYTFETSKVTCGVCLALELRPSSHNPNQEKP